MHQELTAHPCISAIALDRISCGLLARIEASAMVASIESLNPKIRRASVLVKEPATENGRAIGVQADRYASAKKVRQRMLLQAGHHSQMDI